MIVSFSLLLLVIILNLFLFSICEDNPLYILHGAVTHKSFQIKLKSTSNSLVSMNLNGKTYADFQPDSEGYYNITADHLFPNTSYMVKLSYQSSPQNFFYNKTIQTSPPEGLPSPLFFIASSTIRSDSTSYVLEKVKNLNPRFLMVLGNIHDSSEESSDWKKYEEKYFQYVFQNSYVYDLVSAQPLIYFFNDKDFAGPDNSIATSSGISAINKAYREIFPSNPLPGGDTGIYQSFKYGRILFLMTDSRTFLIPNVGNLYGAQQKEWLVNELKKAAADNSISAIFITITQPWNYVKSAYDVDMVKQSYYSILEQMSNDKNTVGDAAMMNINFNRPNNPNFKSVMMIIGERHLAFDDGSWNNFGNFPIAVCGPLDSWQQCRGGPYSHGSFHDGENQYCMFNVYPNPKGNLCINVRGIIASNKTTVNDQIVFMYDTCQPDVFKGRVNLKCPIDFTEKLVNMAITLTSCAIVIVIFYVVIYRASMKALSFQPDKPKQN